MEAPTWLRHTLEEIIGQIRRLLDVSGCAFQVVDFEAGMIRPAAAWFASDEARDSMTPVLERPYDRERPGVTEAAIERGESLLIADFEDWEGATALHTRLEEELEPETARVAWDWYRSSSFISCPVRTAGGRTLGVLAISSRAPQRLLGAEELRLVEVFAGLAALALERSELLDREERRGREERELNEAARAVSTSLEPDAVYAAIVEQARRLVGREQGRAAPLRAGDGRPAHRRGDRLHRGGRAHALPRRRGHDRPGRPHRAALRERSGRRRSVRARVHRARGHRLLRPRPHRAGAAPVRGAHRQPRAARLLRPRRARAPGGAGAPRGRRHRQRARLPPRAPGRGRPHARIRPRPAPSDIPGFELGLVYEPAGHDVGGGDIFGVWTLPSGALAVLVGDVTGKGLEVAALSAMVRFFVEARTWDSERPGEVLAQTDRLLGGRLPSASFVTAFMGVIADGTLRWANAGHAPPSLLRPDGEEALKATGVPLGVEAGARYEEHETPFGPGDVLFASTDGLIEARRDGSFFGERRLPAVLAEHGRTLAPSELVALVYREVEAWAPQLDDDVVLLALRPCP